MEVSFLLERFNTKRQETYGHIRNERIVTYENEDKNKEFAKVIGSARI